MSSNTSAICAITLISVTIIFLAACNDLITPGAGPYSPFDQTYISYNGWHDTSIPKGFSVELELPPWELIMFKSRTVWFNIIPSPIKISDILSDYSQDLSTNTLSISYYPGRKGSYNIFPHQEIKENNWGGLLTTLNENDTKLLNSDFDSSYLYIWIKLPDNFHEAYMQIDIGNISEDIIPNGILNTEDKNANGILDESEDTGLDGLYNLYEVSYDPEQNPDPFCDDFVLPRNLSNPLDYLNIDGTEGNSILPEIGKFPDSEDLNRNNKLDIENHYYSYLVPITLNENNFLADYNEESGWGLLKIPLIDYHYTFGDPYSNSMDKIRLWFTSIEDELLINIAEIKFSKEL